MSEGIIKKFKDWMTVEEEYEEEEYDDIAEEVEPEDIKIDNPSVQAAKKANVVNIHTNNQMKVVIAEPKKYEDVTIIADHLRQRRAVIVNLESVEEEPEEGTGSCISFLNNFRLLNRLRAGLFGLPVLFIAWTL